MFGNVTVKREEAREMWGFPALETFIQDARYGFRQLRRTPLFAAATIVTLALTIGSTSALFAIAHAVVLRPLPYRDSNRIVVATIEQDGIDVGRFDEPTAQLAVRGGTRTFEAVGTYDTTAANLTGGSHPERVRGALVGGAFFEVMGVQPIIGRTFTTDEQQRGGPPVIILSDALWDRAFARASDVAERTVKLDDVSYRIVGVMPAGFGYPARAGYWRPWSPRGTGTALYYVDIVARLRAGLSPAAAREELYALRRAHEGELSARAIKTSIQVVPLHDALRGGFRRPLVLLLGIVACVLLVACANVANLLLARTSGRRRELGLRTALGARRGRLIRQLLIESVLLACLGALPGLLVAYTGLRLFTAFGPPELAQLPGIAIDTAGLLFTLAVTMGTGLLFGVAPAFAAGRANPQAWLKPLSAADGHSTRSHPRRLLVVFELAAAVVLTIGAALLAKSFVHYNAIDRGFHADRVLTASIPLPRPRYANPAARREFSDRVLERLRKAPTIVSATHSETRLGGMMMTIPLPPQFTRSGRASEAESFAVAFVGGDYFRTFGIPIVAGSECPAAPDQRAAIVSQQMARLMFPDRSPLGESIELSGEGQHTIVGVAADVRLLRTNLTDRPRVYACAGSAHAPLWGTLAVRARDDVDPDSLAPLVREAVKAADPSQPIVDVKTVPGLVGEAVLSRWFESGLIVGFAAIAVVLSVFGLYAVVAYLVAQRTHEIGVRMALGARRSDVVRLVLRQGTALTAAGVALGVLAALPLVRFVRSMLFDVEPLDAGVFAATAVLLATVALVAALIPALRASRVDPIIALRAE